MESCERGRCRNESYGIVAMEGRVGVRLSWEKITKYWREIASIPAFSGFSAPNFQPLDPFCVMFFFSLAILSIVLVCILHFFPILPVSGKFLLGYCSFYCNWLNKFGIFCIQFFGYLIGRVVAIHVDDTAVIIIAMHQHCSCCWLLK